MLVKVGRHVNSSFKNRQQHFRGRLTVGEAHNFVAPSASSYTIQPFNFMAKIVCGFLANLAKRIRPVSASLIGRVFVLIVEPLAKYLHRLRGFVTRWFAVSCKETIEASSRCDRSCIDESGFCHMAAIRHHPTCLFAVGRARRIVFFCFMFLQLGIHENIWGNIPVGGKRHLP